MHGIYLAPEVRNKNGDQPKQPWGKPHALGCAFSPLLDVPDHLPGSRKPANTAPLISKEYGFSKVTMGIIFSAFIWAYALFQVPGGWLGDRFGPRKSLDDY